MLRAKYIEDSLLGLVGWKQTDDANPDLLLSSNLLGSESGLYYQQAHPLLTLNNMASIAPDFSDYTKPEYDEAATYLKDQVVKVTAQDEGEPPVAAVKYFKAIDNVPAGINPKSLRAGLTIGLKPRRSPNGLKTRRALLSTKPFTRTLTTSRIKVRTRTSSRTAFSLMSRPAFPIKSVIPTH